MKLHSGLVLCGALILSASGSPAHPSGGNVLELHLRSRDGAGVVERVVHWEPVRTAIIICDMWDQNWCKGATERASAMVPRMNRVLDAARNAGVTIIHAPSETMAFYREAPGRRLVLSAPPVRPPFPIPKWINPDPAREAPYPIDDSDGGCNDTPRCTQGRPWTRQISTLKIMDGDGISDDGEEIYSFLRERGITNVVLMGVHLNFCVLGRPFGIRAQKLLGMNVVLARDLAQALYNHRMPPYVSLAEADSLMAAHIERYWAPSIASDDLVKTMMGVGPTEYVSAVNFMPGGGTFFGKNVSVRMECATMGAEIRYTLDGKTPGEHASLYRGPLTITGTSIVKGRAFKQDAIESDVANAEFVLADSARNGLHYAYYEGNWKSLPEFTQLRVLSEGYAFGLDPAMVKRRPDGFAVKYSGYLAIPSGGTYTCALTSGDGSRLFVNGRLVVDNDGQHAPAKKEGTATLESGLQPVTILYFSVEGANEQSLRLDIRNPEGEWRRVTGDMLFRER